MLPALLRLALEERGDHAALCAGDRVLTGRQLLAEADGLAAVLVAKGVRPGDVIAVSVDRTVNTVIGLVAVLLAGGAYLPVEPSTPSSWITHLLEVASARVVLCAESLHPRFGPGALGLAAELIDLRARHADRVFVVPPRADALAYVMGTSGTTGRPKAVPIRAQSLLDYCRGFVDMVGGGERIRGANLACMTTLAADLGLTMVFPALLEGGTLHLVSEEVARDPRCLADYVERHHIDAFKTVPTHLRVLLREGARVLPRRFLVVGGETFGLDLLEALERLQVRCEVFNHYGPTETTVGVAMYRASTRPGSAASLRALGCQSVPIGRALGKAQVRVVDKEVEVSTPDQCGEILVGGPTVCAGYMGGTDREACNFVRAQWSVVGPVYRTGDAARILLTGEIEHLGRLDGQVKVRGHRVETSAVEAVLRQHPAVIDAHAGVATQEAIVGALVAWVHVDTEIEEADLRRWLLARLPAPMVPSRLLFLPSLPRTSNGKLDRAALPEPQSFVADGEGTGALERIRMAFAQALAIGAVREDDDFFRLGGDSLLALRLLYVLETGDLCLSVEAFYEDPTPRGVVSRATQVKPSRASAQYASIGVNPQVHALWAHLQALPEDPSYEIPLHLRVAGAVGPEAVKAALRAFVSRHAVLQTLVIGRDGHPELRRSPDLDQVVSLDEEAWTNRLDFARGPLLRGNIQAVEGGGVDVVLRVHHMAFDGASTAVLVRELVALLLGEPLPPAPTFQPRKVGRTEVPPLGDGARATLGLPALPGAIARAPQLVSLPLPAGLWGDLVSLASAIGATPFACVLAGWALVMARQDGLWCVTVGTPADLREAGQEECVGFYSNVVVVEVAMNPSQSGRDLVRATHRAVGLALGERNVPYSQRVALQREASGTPPTRTLITVERLERAGAGGLEVRQLPIECPRPVFPLDLAVSLEDTVEVLRLHLDADSCPPERGRCLLDQLLVVLEQLARAPGTVVRDLGLLSPAWRQRVLGWSQGEVLPVPTVWGATAYQVGAAPDSIALCWPGGSWTRAAFEDAVQHAVARLRARGLGPGHAASTLIDPCPALAVAWHAVHRLGAAVLALDPSWPAERLRTIEAAARATIRLSSADGVALEVEGNVSSAPPHDADLAYLISTSGSTGAPKLVAVQRTALALEFAWSAEVFPIDERDRVLAHSAPSFDVIVWEMLGPLSWGAQLVFPALGRWRDAGHLAARMQEAGVTVVQAVPSLIEVLLTRFLEGPSCLRLLVSGGEELSGVLRGQLARKIPRCRLFNTYGPTETAIDAIFYEVPASHPPDQRVPLGRPKACAQAYVLTESHGLLPPGAWGQLFIGGAAVGRGYVGDPDATRARFLPDPWAAHEGSLMYLTGDRARWTLEGMLEFGGRLDHQVKVRGNRVEIEAVEMALRDLSEVRDAAVFLSDGGSMWAHLVALVVAASATNPTTSSLYGACISSLPAHMVPSRFVVVDRLPRLDNGKLDRAALPEACRRGVTDRKSVLTDTEHAVGRAWAKTIGREDLDLDASFFANGGTSLLVPILQLHVREETGRELPIPALFEHTTVQAQAILIEGGAAHGGDAKGSSRVRANQRRQAYGALRKGRNR